MQRGTLSFAAVGLELFGGEDFRVRGKGKEVREFFTGNEMPHQGSGAFVCGIPHSVDLGSGEVKLVGDYGLDQLKGYGQAVVHDRVVVDPLPQLRSADLGGGGVFHQVKERHAADAAQPCLNVTEADRDVLPQAGFSDGAFG